MNKKVLMVILLLATLTTIGFTSAYFSTSSNVNNKFDTKDYNFKINGLGGTYNSFDLTISNGKSTLPTPTKDGYAFIGYSNTENGNVLYSKNIDNIDDINNKEIYAKYEIENYSISYNLNDGSASSLVYNYNAETDSFTLPTPVREGYTFVGWTGTGLSSVTPNVTINKGSTGNRSYTANWTANTYTISYNLNGGSNSSLVYNYNIESNDFTLPIPSRQGYDFTGWTGTGLGSATQSVTINKGSIGNRNYTANWQKYNAVDSGGIYLVSLRNNTTWAYTLDGYYTPGATTVVNWIITVENNCAHINGTQYPTNTYTYQFYAYKTNNRNELLGTASAAVSGGGKEKASATICW